MQLWGLCVSDEVFRTVMSQSCIGGEHYIFRGVRGPIEVEVDVKRILKL
jgi:hypothetical protein